MGNTNKQILVVDDNLQNLQMTTRILQDEGYKVSLALDGPIALEQLEFNLPDLILLDIMMPEMDGLEVCRILKKKPALKEIPVIFLTAKTQSEDLKDGFNAGGVDYITKPFRKEELLVRVKNHIELADSRNRIFELYQTKAKLYSIISHDLRSPFAAITQVINAIHEGYLDTDSPEFLEIFSDLEKTTQATSALLENLLNWSSFQSGSLPFSPIMIDLVKLIYECIQLLERSATNKKINFNLDLPNSIQCYCDEVSMHTVLRNLISNAIKFTREGGTISIHVSGHEQTTKIIIEDTGLGIEEDVIEKIFTKNEHYTSKGTSEEMGTGLGLHLVKEFIEKNKGKIQVESKKDVGTKFTILLPDNP